MSKDTLEVYASYVSSFILDELLQNSSRVTSPESRAFQGVSMNVKLLTESFYTLENPPLALLTKVVDTILEEGSAEIAKNFSRLWNSQNRAQTSIQ